MNEQGQLKGDRQTGKGGRWLELGGVGGTVVRLTWDHNHKASKVVHSTKPGPQSSVYSPQPQLWLAHCGS